MEKLVVSGACPKLKPVGVSFGQATIRILGRQFVETFPVLSTNASFKLLNRDLGRSLSQVADAADVKRESAYYLANIVKVKSIDDFLKNDRLYNFAMQAFGMKDMIYAKAFVRKVLTDGIDNSKSFANQLADPRFRELAETFNFARYGGTTTVFDRTQQGTVDRFLRARLEERAGQDNEGVRLALYFQRKAPEIDSALGILADPALLRVAQIALGIPASGANIDKQAESIARKLDVESLKDPAKLAKFLDRFTSLWEASSGGNTESAPRILLTQPLEFSIGPETLMKLQSWRMGGQR